MANGNGSKDLMSDVDFSKYMTPSEKAPEKPTADVDFTKYMDPSGEAPEKAMSDEDFTKHMPVVSPESHRIVSETSTPDSEAEAYKNAEVGGITPELARKTPEAAKNRAEFQQIEGFLKEWDAKGTKKALQDPLFMASARDDVQALVEVEKSIRSFPTTNEQRELLGVDPTPLKGDRQFGGNIRGDLNVYDDFMRGVGLGQETIDLGKLGSELSNAYMFGGNKEKISPSGRGWFESAGQLVPVMGEIIKEGHTTGAKFGLGGAGLAALTTFYAPPAMAISVPVAATTMYGAGVKIGAFESMFNLERGNAFLEFLEMRDDNGDFLDPSIANGAALGVGFINASLEFVGMKFIAGMFGSAGQKALGNFSTKMMKQALQNKSTRAAIQTAMARYVTGVGGESLTEAAQEVANILLGGAAADIQNQVRGYEDIFSAEFVGKTLDPDNLMTAVQEHGPRVLEAFEVAAKGTTLIGLPAFAVSSGGRVKRARANAELAENFERQQREISEKTAETLTAERNPQMYQAFLEKHMGLKGQQAYLDGDDILELEQNSPEVIEELVKNSGMSKAEILEGAKNGQALGLGLSAFHARLAPEIQNKLFKHIKATPGGYSVAQVQEGLTMAEEVFEDQFNGFMVEEESINQEMGRIEQVAFDSSGDPAHAASVASTYHSTARRLAPKDVSGFLKRLDMNNPAFRAAVERGTVGTLGTLEAIQTEISRKERQLERLEAGETLEKRRKQDRRIEDRQFTGEEQRKSRERRLAETAARPPVGEQAVTVEEELAILERKHARIIESQGLSTEGLGYDQSGPRIPIREGDKVSIDAVTYNENLLVYLDQPQSDAMVERFGQEWVAKTYENMERLEGEFGSWRYVYKNEQGEYVGVVQGVSSGTEDIVSSVYVRPDYRGKGIATKILDQVRAEQKNLVLSGGFSRSGAKLMGVATEEKAEETLLYQRDPEILTSNRRHNRQNNNYEICDSRRGPASLNP